MEAKIYRDFLALLRLGIGHEASTTLNDVDWPAVEAFANVQGLSAVVLDGVEVLRTNENYNLKLPEIDFLTQWIGEVLQGYESIYDLYCHTIAEMAAFYNSQGFKMMVLKGYVCSLNWPRPEHRPCGDIDIWQFGRQKEADIALTKVKGIKIDNSHHHHTVFHWRDFMVENHYDFINIHHHKSNYEVERVLKELAQDDSNTVELYGQKVYLPSANLHAFFLLKHLMMHFAAESISLRQLLDWAFFMKAHHQEIDWPWFTDKLKQFGMTTMFNIINAICVEDLGFNAEVFHDVQFNPFVKEKVLKDILEPAFGSELPKRLIPRLVFKFRRWKGSAWKHELCYKESMWSAFWSGLWNHLLKPSSI